MAPGPSPLLRAGLLLFSIAVVGVLIGFSWEMSLHEEEAPFEEISPSEPGDLPASPRWYTGPSEAERAVIRRATLGLPPYKDAVPQALAADFLDPGSRIAAAWFMTRDTPDEVLGFYRNALLDAGLPVVQHRYDMNAGYVGYMEPHTEEVHTVSVIAQSGETAVFVSSGQVSSFLESQSQLPTQLPMPQGAREPVVLTFREEGRTRYSVMADVPQAQVAELTAFYRRAFETEGWKLEDTSEQGSGTHLLASRDGARATAMVRREGENVRLYLTLDEDEKVQPHPDMPRVGAGVSE